MQRRVTPATIQAAERREREAAAPRLATEIPGLAALDIHFEEESSYAAPLVSYVRRVVVGIAPAHFEVTCGDSACKDGGHDLTSSILLALRSRKIEFSGDDACHGSVKVSACRRVLRYKATARYEVAESAGAR
jgi:hypothetical protein